MYRTFKPHKLSPLPPKKVVHPKPPTPKPVTAVTAVTAVKATPAIASKDNKSDTAADPQSEVYTTRDKLGETTISFALTRAEELYNEYIFRCITNKDKKDQDEDNDEYEDEDCTPEDFSATAKWFYEAARFMIDDAVALGVPLNNIVDSDILANVATYENNSRHINSSQITIRNFLKKSQWKDFANPLLEHIGTIEAENATQSTGATPSSMAANIEQLSPSQQILQQRMLLLLSHMPGYVEIVTFRHGIHPTAKLADLQKRMPRPNFSFGNAGIKKRIDQNKRAGCYIAFTKFLIPQACESDVTEEKKMQLAQDADSFLMHWFQCYEDAGSYKYSDGGGTPSKEMISFIEEIRRVFKHLILGTYDTYIKDTTNTAARSEGQPMSDKEKLKAILATVRVVDDKKSVPALIDMKGTGGNSKQSSSSSMAPEASTATAAAAGVKLTM